MNLNESFRQSSKKRNEKKIESFKLDMRASAAAALAHTPCSHQHNVVDHSFLLAVPRVARRHVKDRASNWRASSSSSSVPKRVTASRLEASAGPWYFSPNLLRALRWKRLLVVCWTLRSHDELAPPKTLEKEEGVPRWNQCWRLWARQIGASSAWFYSLAWSVFAGTLPILWGSDRDPARQTETCECEPCVILALRSWNEVEVSMKHRVYGVHVLCLFLLLFLLSFFFFFFIFTFFRNGQGQPPPPLSPNGHARILVNAEIYGRSLNLFSFLLSLVEPVTGTRLNRLMLISFISSLVSRASFWFSAVLQNIDLVSFLLPLVEPVTGTWFYRRMFNLFSLLLLSVEPVTGTRLNRRVLISFHFFSR